MKSESLERKLDDSEKIFLLVLVGVILEIAVLVAVKRNGRQVHVLSIYLQQKKHLR